MAGLPLRIIVGLGNPGPEHQVTRHNAGFWFVDLLARRHGGEFRDYRKYSGETARISIERQRARAVEADDLHESQRPIDPPVERVLQDPPEEILVAHDELDLPVGSVRLKQGGGHGGHNGLRDTIAHIGENVLAHALRHRPSRQQGRSHRLRVDARAARRRGSDFGMRSARRRIACRCCSNRARNAP